MDWCIGHVIVVVVHICSPTLILVKDHCQNVHYLWELAKLGVSVVGINRHSRCFVSFLQESYMFSHLMNSIWFEVLEYYLLYAVSIFCYCEVSSNSFTHHCKTRLRQEAPCVINPKNFHGESLSTQVKGCSLLHANCSWRREIVTPGHGNCRWDIWQVLGGK